MPPKSALSLTEKKAITAVEQGDIQQLSAMVRDKIDLSNIIIHGSSLTHIATRYGQLNVLIFLALHGLDFNKMEHDGTTPALIAAEEGRMDILSLLSQIKNINFNVPRDDGTTPALMAADNGHVAVLAFLQKKGVDLNQTYDDDGAGLAHVAAEEGHIPVLIFLMHNKIDLNQRTINGSTPAFLAAEEGHLDVVKLFAHLGLDLNLARADGLTPLDIALENENEEVVDFLNSRMISSHPSAATKKDTDNHAGSTIDDTEIDLLHLDKYAFIETDDYKYPLSLLISPHLIFDTSSNSIFKKNKPGYIEIESTLLQHQSWQEEWDETPGNHFEKLCSLLDTYQTGSVPRQKQLSVAALLDKYQANGGSAIKQRHQYGLIGKFFHPHLTCGYTNEVSSTLKACRQLPVEAQTVDRLFTELHHRLGVNIKQLHKQSDLIIILSIATEAHKMHPDLKPISNKLS
ncbi:MAG: ankyrin repeat domain-containing protein [Legionellales bacterium]